MQNPDVGVGHITTYYVSTVSRTSVRMMRITHDRWMVTMRRGGEVYGAHFTAGGLADSFARSYAAMLRYDDGVVTLLEMLEMYDQPA